MSPREMFDRLRQIFGAKKEESPEDPMASLAEAWQDQKSNLMETVLGREHDIVMHAIIPYALGGGLDLYYYPHSIPASQSWPFQARFMSWRVKYRRASTMSSTLSLS